MGFFIVRNTLIFYIISVFHFNVPTGEASWMNVNGTLGALTDILSVIRGSTFASSINNVYNAPVTSDRIENNAVTNAKIANNAVTAAKIQNRTITPIKIASSFTDYFTTEQNTGCLWIDGKTIYRKEINLGSLPNAVPGSIPHGISNIDTIVRLYGFATNGSAFLPLPLARYSNFESQIGLWADKTYIVVEPGNDRRAFTGYVVIEYTKTS
jgi:hypothetical protein